VVEFDDASYVGGRRDALYYVRAIQKPSPAINAGGLRCTQDGRVGQVGQENCGHVAPCYGDWRTPEDDDCLASNEERAWSSPIYLAWSAGTADNRSSSPR
jgi:hypothetical protein